MARLAGKVAFITGAGTGIGRATAILFAREGARVVIAEIDAAAGEETAHLAGHDAIAIRTDVTDEASLQAAIRTTVQQFGALHVLHNNAGGSTPQDSTVVEAPHRRVLARDPARSVRHLPGLSFRHPGDHPFGRRLGDQHVVERGADGDRRSRLLHRGEGRRRGDDALDGGGIRVATLRVNAIAPSATMTERVRKLVAGNAALGKLADAHLLGLIEPQDIANMALFLASDESRMVTGQMYPVDSGVTIS